MTQIDVGLVKHTNLIFSEKAGTSKIPLGFTRFVYEMTFKKARPPVLQKPKAKQSQHICRRPSIDPCWLHGCRFSLCEPP